MTRRPREEDRAHAFGVRAFHEGNLQDYVAATRVAWAFEDRRRERREARIEAARNAPGCVWVAGLIVTGLALVAAVSWVLDHPILSCLLLLGCVAGGVTRWRVKAKRPAAVEAELMAPPDVRRKAELNTLTMALPAEVRAIVSGLNPARTRLYLDAVEMRAIAAPTRRTLEGRDVVEAQLPGGDIRPEDVDVVRLGQTLGFEPDRVRLMPAPAGLLMVELLHTRPSELEVPAWPALGRATSWTDPCPIGVDELAHPVALTLAGTRTIVTGQSGSGKSRAARMLALFAASDPTTRLHIIDFKGDDDWQCLADRADSYSSEGIVTDDVIARLTGLRDAMRERYAARRRGEVDETHTVIVVDEAHRLFERKEAEPLIEEIARQGRAAGYSLILATQLATQRSIPVAVLGQCNVRVVMRQGAKWAGGQLLEDHDVDVLGLPDGHAVVWDMRAGRRYRVGVHHVDDEGAALHTRTLYALPPARELPVIVAADHDADDRLDDETDLLLADVAATIADRPGIPWAVLADDLGIEREELQAQLRTRGITSAAYYCPDAGKTVRGVRRADVEAARRA